MNCPDAFTALAKRQAFQRERTSEQFLSHRRGKRASRIRSQLWTTESARGHKLGPLLVVQMRGRGRERGGQRSSHAESEERRELVIAYYFWARKETSGTKGRTEGFTSWSQVAIITATAMGSPLRRFFSHFLEISGLSRSISVEREKWKVLSLSFSFSLLKQDSPLCLY